MNIGIIGTGRSTEVRAQVAATMAGVTVVGMLATVPDDLVDSGDGASALLDDFLRGLDVVFIAGPTALHYRVAEAAAKRGVHLFMEWPPATSIREGEAMVRLVEEAGVEAGVSRPLRFHPLFAALPAETRLRLVVLRQGVPAEAFLQWPQYLADAVDLCCALAGSGSVQRVDAEAVRRGGAWPEAMAFTLRFHNATYAQVTLQRQAVPERGTLYVASSSFQHEVTLDEDRWDQNASAGGAFVSSPLLEAETRAFLEAIATVRPVPVSIIDGLHTLRLVERLMTRLR